MKLVNGRKTAAVAEKEPAWAAAIRDRWGGFEKFATVFNPGMQDALARNPRKAFANERVPSISRSEAAYGYGNMLGWLTLQLSTLGEVMPEGKRMETGMLRSVASDLLCNPAFRTLNVAEAMLFLKEFRMGMFGKVYGALTGIDLNVALQQFCAKRRAAIDKIEREREREERERHDREAMTWEQYCAVKGIEAENRT